MSISDIVEVITAVVITIVLVLLLIVLFTCINSLNPSVQVHTISITAPIKSLDLKEATASTGNMANVFFIGYGEYNSSDEEYFVFYEQVGKNSYKLEKVPTEETIITETNEQPKVQYVCKYAVYDKNSAPTGVEISYKNLDDMDSFLQKAIRSRIDPSRHKDIYLIGSPEVTLYIPKGTIKVKYNINF
ncbi:hypothetical protein SAMN02746089_02575 [Caldanaerobius fijiensis DSM 17918]|uniref:Uncharacterized protein n=1 Tax=Caldanaerobius fijiensis DSM 17918 TaxID=1121256 RepID=A0A1M5ELU2_9THEO|nr:hypothetical protein [Caldanaerobius fijiensis]SHF80114.1 hypothetical protein SAMN02746089_02575 [Caldanaerobius fijiensis DSM 17918]